MIYSPANGYSMEDKDTNQPESTFNLDDKTGNEEKTVLPVFEEQLVICKTEIETGKVHIRKRVSEEVVSVNLPVKQEHYEVERRAVNKGLLKEYPAVRHEGETIIIPVVREVLVVEKRYEIVEEVHILKTVSEIPHLHEITLKKESVDVTKSSNP